MATIQTTIGLFSGIDIAGTVEALMKFSAQPKEAIETRTKTIENKQAAITELAARLLSVQYLTDNLGKTDLYDSLSVKSGNTSVLTATLTGTPTKGSFQYTAIRTARQNQVISSGMASSTAPIGEGQLSFRFGADVQRSAELDWFGGGEGVSRGHIRITDRSGDSAEIDLTTVRTVDDVLDAINANTEINVTAEAAGDSIRLVDNTGKTDSNLMVEEVGGNTTAASLGLDGIDVASDTADGADMLWLTRDTQLNVLNDGGGVIRDAALADIHYQLADGTEGYIDLSPIASGTSNEAVETTLGEILDVINAEAPDKLKIEIAGDGDRLVLTDLTAGGGSFTVESAFGSNALADLGLDATAVGGVIGGRRIFGGAGTVLLSSLGGGNGLGDLGAIELTDRGGASATVDLSGAETLDDLIETINAAPVEIEARVNDAGTGIVLVDTSGNPAGNLVVANADATGTADLLNLAVDENIGSVDSGDLHLQVVSHNTKLADLNGGAGVTRGDFTIVDSSGMRSKIDLRIGEYETIGDVIKAVNLLDVNVQARINDTGDGIVIEDLAHGDGTLQILEGETSAAGDLHLLGGAATVEIGGEPTQVIDGSTTYTIDVDAATSLDDLVAQIKALDAGVQAVILEDGASKPYRLSLTSERSGKAGQLVIDTSRLGFSFEQITAGQDAMLGVGGGDNGPAVLFSSSTNEFTGMLPGVTLEIQGVSSSPVTVSVQATDTSLVANVGAMVSNYNGFRELLNELTSYDEETTQAGLLLGDSVALRLDTDLSSLLSGRIFGASSIQSLGELGIGFDDDGTLEFDQSRFEELYSKDPDAVKNFFAEEESGFSDKFAAVVKQLAGGSESLLSYRLNALQQTIDDNRRKIEFLGVQLEIQEQRLYTDFYAMEAAIGKVQADLRILDAFTPLEPNSITRNR